ncbi:MAG: hypothetical protein LBT00_01390 [Spirochaetaceae bacterium]|nr:hypothetical protein [Spirochaetaceae bacterium]
MPGIGGTGKSANTRIPVPASRHCESVAGPSLRSEQGEAIQKGRNALDCFAPLAMTADNEDGRHCEPEG